MLELLVTRCFFVSDLHGSEERYKSLFDALVRERPDALFLGGDLLPNIRSRGPSAADAQCQFIDEFLRPRFLALRRTPPDAGARVFLILGNDDARSTEPLIRAAASEGAWEYVHFGRASLDGFDVYGYSFVPPTPFLLKDWERYDVSRHVDPGCVSPEEGKRTVPVSESEARYSTIARDLKTLVGPQSLDKSVFLFHTPPHGTSLDRAALDGVIVDHVQVDVHVGSIAVRRFTVDRSPLLTLHGHIHEAGRLTGQWKEHLGSTTIVSAAHDGPELALIRFDLENPSSATRELL